jgi:P27 family predicted phage terminase small subunit
MPKGRKKTAPAVKAVRGGKKPARGPRPSGQLTPPEHLDRIGREEWERITAELQANGQLLTSHRSALAIYCTAYSRWIRANYEIANSGVTTFTDAGGIKANPAVSAAATAEAIMTRILEQFGATPASRSRVTNIGAAPKDDLSEFLAKKPK